LKKFLSGAGAGEAPGEEKGKTFPFTWEGKKEKAKGSKKQT